MKAEALVDILLESRLKFSRQAEQALWADLWSGVEGFPFDLQGIEQLLATLDARTLMLLWHRYEKRSTLATAGAQVHSLRSPESGLDKERVRSLILRAFSKMRQHYTNPEINWEERVQRMRERRGES